MTPIESAPGRAQSGVALLSLREISYRHPGVRADRRAVSTASSAAIAAGTARIDREIAQAVSSVTLSIAPGEVVGLCGPNAAGKSTLARLACGLLRPDGGTIQLNGAPMQSLSARARAKQVAFLGQQAAIELPFTGREVALMGRAPHLGLWALEAPGDRACAASALAELDVLHLADRPVSRMSGGERQRVFLARAFAQEAQLTVLDEPTQALDLAHQALLVNAVRSRARKGKSALLVLHDLSLAAAACDRIALLVEGKILAEGPPGEVLVPALLEKAYSTVVDVVIDPATGLPLVAPRVVR